MQASVLLLNADAQPLSLLPLSTISWQTAVKALYSEKVFVIKNYEGLFLNSNTISLPLPSIVMLNSYHRPPLRAKYTRKNLYIRDDYNCQYCGNKFSYSDLTIDHVIPKSKGGKLTWENSVAACRECNFKKNDKIIKPIRKPVMPSWHQLNFASRNYKTTIPDPSWQEFIQWPTENLVINDNPVSL